MTIATKITALTIERLAHDLRGVAYAQGQSWFVEGALPGEQVEARILMQRQQMIDAETVTVLTAATQRIAAACEYYGRCGGCSLQHVSYETQLTMKQQVLLDQLQRIGGVTPQEVLPALSGEAWAYRRRARLACKWSSEKKTLLLGLRARHSQQIVEIGHCAVLVPALQSLLQPLRACLSQWSQPRQIGHVELLAADNGVAVLLRLMAQPDEADAQLLRDFSAACDVSVFLQCEEKNGAEFFCGSQQLLDCFHHASDTGIACAPGDFVQSNAAINVQLVDAVLTSMQTVLQDNVLEAFCGLGNFTFPLARQVNSVTGIELSEAMLARAHIQATENGVRNIGWRAVDLNQFDRLKQPLPAFNKVLLDPPRDGAQVFCKHVDVKKVQRLVYVSCNPSTLARDAGILAERGMVLQSVRLVDMFPQTEHIEALAVFVPGAARKKVVAVKNSQRRLRR